MPDAHILILGCTNDLLTALDPFKTAVQAAGTIVEEQAPPPQELLEALEAMQPVVCNMVTQIETYTEELNGLM